MSRTALEKASSQWLQRLRFVLLALVLVLTVAGLTILVTGIYWAVPEILDLFRPTPFAPYPLPWLVLAGIGLLHALPIVSLLRLARLTKLAGSGMAIEGLEPLHAKALRTFCLSWILIFLMFGGFAYTLIL